MRITRRMARVGDIPRQRRREAVIRGGAFRFMA